jgi:hypothetical protein
MHEWKKRCYLHCKKVDNVVEIQKHNMYNKAPALNQPPEMVAELLKSMHIEEYT